MSAGLLNSAECIGRAVERAVAATGAIQVDLCVHRFSPNGVTAVATPAGSHLAVHP
ncbi:MAG: S-adenosylmethionine decarboxylase [Acidobacteriota bacterium]|nr:S-adenosylmethionine decarboxylase [Acidobacteriota bacterium]